MNDKNNFSVSPALLKITERDVSLLDQEVADGEGWNSYTNGQMTQTTVYHNRLTGVFFQGFEQFDVEVDVTDNQLSSRCTCENHNQVCQHVSALLYAWVSDADAFLNVGLFLKDLKSKNHQELLDLLSDIVEKNPANIFLLNKNTESPDSIEDIDGLLN